MASIIRFIVVNVDTGDIASEPLPTLKDARDRCVLLAASGERFQAFTSVGGVFKLTTKIEQVDE